MNIIFTKPTARILTGLSKRYKNKKGGKYEYYPGRKWPGNVLLAQNLLNF